MLLPFSALCRFSQSSIGRKIIIAVTGLLLVGFLAVHLAGNLLMYAGPDAINDYAKKLHSMGPLIWVARLGLLGIVGLHIVYTIRLTRANRAARLQGYAVNVVQTASRGSRSMIWSGLTILAFVVYHLAHYTAGLGNEYRDVGKARYFLASGDHNAYQMVVDGFGVWYVSAFYVVAMGLLFMHLSHGVGSMAQTLGVTTPRTRGLIEWAGRGLAGALFLGFASIPVAVMTGFLK